MDPTISEWLNLVLRWAHVITGIAWIGSSFFFMWLDSHLEKPDPPRGQVEGFLWMTHGGGFYNVEKMQLAPSELPKTLHWFKWEAAWTFITGFLLLVVVYYLGSEAFLLDPAVSDISKGEAVGIGLGALVISWFVYDGLYRSPLRNTGFVVELIGIALLIAVILILFNFLNGRAAYVHVGAIVGTIMVANVWIIIIPGQRRLVEATKNGTPLNAQDAFNAKQRSVHNNYLTLPVVFIMLSSHYPSTYGHEYGWAILIGMFVVGGLVRHWFNMRNAGNKGIWPVPASIVAILLVFWFASPWGPTAATVAESDEPISFAQAYDVIAKHCISCHAVKPSNEDFDQPPKNVVLETPDQIKLQAAKIRAVTVLTNTMPLGNLTEMTKAERALLGQWIAEGAETE